MSRRKTIVALACMAVLTACAALSPDLPAITDSPTGQTHTGKVVWHDLLTNTPAESRKFYGELFGWTFEEPKIDLGFGDESSYMLIRHQGQLIGGMVNTNSLGRSENVSQWIAMMSVADIATAVEKVSADGGKVLTPPTTLPSRGTLAVIEDPTGALMAFIQTKDGDPADEEPMVNGFLWDELWTNDIERASNFYRHIIGFKRENRPFAGAEHGYHLLKTDDRPRAGIINNPFVGQHPVWVNYLRVEDPAAITARVEALGGKVLIEAQDRDIGGQVAFVAGPSGAGIALQTWPLN